MAVQQETDKIFIQWWTKIQKRVLSIAQHYLESSDVEDLAQDVAIAAYQRFDIFKNQEHFDAWVTNCARWFSIDRVRAKKPTIDSYDSLDSFISSNPPQDVSTWLSEVQEVFQRLPLNQREALSLWAEGYSSREIAKELKVEESTVRSLRRHARLKLAEALFHNREK